MTIPFDLRQLAYFVAVSEERNIGRAAQRLHISQPPLSRQIQQLEARLGVKLFLRASAGVTLTQAGETFLPEARKTLAQAEKAATAVREMRKEACRQFRVGYTTVFDRSVIPNLTEVFDRRWPEWQLTMQGEHSISLVRSLLNGTLDIGFIGLHTQSRGLATTTIYQEPLVAALPEKHPLAAKDSLTVADLEDELLFWFERRLNPGFYDHCQAVFSRINFRPCVLPEPTDHHIMLGTIAEGSGIALISASLQSFQRKGVVFRKLSEQFSALTSGIAIAWATDNPSPILQDVLETVKACRPV